MNNTKQVQALTQELKVLYVEDDDAIRRQLVNIFQRFFNEVVVGIDGEDGLKKYQEHGAIDLIISDIQMPKMNGLEMIKAIKSIDEEQPALIISAHNELGFFSEAIHIGIDGFIIKPVTTEQLFESLYKIGETIRTRIENIRYQEELESMVRERTRRLEKQMLTDELTGFYNRKRLDTLLADGKERTVLLADIDNFSRVNTAYGYRFSDKILIAVADQIKNRLPEGAALFRINGDQFVYLAETIDTNEAAKIAADMLTMIQNNPFIIDGIDISLTMTVGIDTGKSEETLIRAYTAVKESRIIGNSRFDFYNSESQLEAKQKNNLEWTKRVKQALDNDTIVPYFQPIVNNYTRKVEKYECLVRIDDGEQIVSPGLFLEAATHSGMLPDITRIMIEKSCRYFSKRSESFTINITEHDLKEGYLPDFLADTTDRYGIVPERLTLEILENISAEGTDDALDQLMQFKEMGFAIALDDFGSETSNFSRLRNLQVDYIKIDGSYIKNVDTDENSMKIVQTITKFAELIDAKVIAEYVHSESVEKAVRDLWIHYSQGYYFGKPVRELGDI